MLLNTKLNSIVNCRTFCCEPFTKISYLSFFKKKFYEFLTEKIIMASKSSKSVEIV